MEKKNEWIELVKTALPKDKLISECIPKEMEHFRAISIEAERRKEIEILEQMKEFLPFESHRAWNEEDAHVENALNHYRWETLEKINSRIASLEAPI